MQYSAFISYSHADEKIARWLMGKLETFNVPSKLVGSDGEFGPIPRKIGKVFRDRDELSSSGDLGSTVNQALLNSNSLIVICSPDSAQSKWVNNEVAEFRKLGREQRIFSFIVGGEPQSRAPGVACFPASLLAPEHPGEPEREPLAADARDQGDGKQRAFLKLAAGLLGVGFDALAQRDAQRRFRRMAAITTASVIGMSIAVVLAVSAFLARNDAQRRQQQAEDIVGFMLGDLRQRLETVGRLDLMRSVDDKAIEYFSNLDARDLSDRTLEEQARSLTGIGEVRLNEGNYIEAMNAFKEAHLRTSALYQRAPENAQRLFDLSQAEFWRGYVAWEQGRYQDAQMWLSRYRDSAIKLAAIDPDNFDWQREVAYGYHNLAVLDKSRGNFAQAEAHMLAERKLYSNWLEQFPEDLVLRFEAANVDSWLGSLALEQGKLGAAQGYFQKQVQAIEQNLLAEPHNIEWREIHITSLKLLGQATENLQQLEQSERLFQQALMLTEQLHNRDPLNIKWMLEFGNSHWRLVHYAGENSHFHLEQASQLISRAFEANPKDERSAYFLAGVKTFHGRKALIAGDIDLAKRLAKESQDILAAFWREDVPEELRTSYARSLILKGELHHYQQDFGVAQQVWQDALQILSESTKGEVPFIRLPDLIVVSEHLGQKEQATAYQLRLSAAIKQ
ncbi:toll/interleukin-1 receptor domain-containing protein [Aliiglaciecola litoralis]|uniref:TIR domain-containing protein n=1 Tax=Aliiglaciecola litoralis TaxID=582857 RepID=A0ABP3WU25_9ALTE